MLYLNYGKIVFWIVGEIQCIFVFFHHHLIKKATYTAWIGSGVEKYIKYRLLKSIKKQLHNCTMKDILLTLISTRSQ